MPKETEAQINDNWSKGQAPMVQSWESTQKSSADQSQDAPSGSQNKVDQKRFKYFAASDILQKTISDLEVTTPSNRISIAKSSVESKIKIIPECFSFIMYNILRNSICNLETHPNLKITVGLEKKYHENENYLSIYVHDTGPGIHPDEMSKLFDNSQNDRGGLGLAFCKRNMQIFGGDIICESEYGEWTKFSLLFPIIDSEEGLGLGSGKRVLIVDDEKINLMTAKAKIEKNLKGVECVIEGDSRKALSMISKKDHGFDLILSDYEMPKLNGYEFSEGIRKKDKLIPIIIYSSRLHRDFLSELNFINAPFSQYLRKDVKNPILYRSISKWLNLDDPMDYLGEEKEYIHSLGGKTILVADDDALNRKVIKRKIEGCGAKVMEVADGEEMVNIYVKNSGKIDVIISDINMPGMNGDEATEEIRKIEAKNGVHHSARIPIIAITGNGTDNDIKKYLDCKMMDYYIKGSNPELIIKLIANYLNRF